MRSDVAIASAERLLGRALKLGALRYGEFTLASGAKSSYYFDGRLLTTDGESVEIVADMFVDLLIRAATSIGSAVPPSPQCRSSEAWHSQLFKGITRSRATLCAPSKSDMEWASSLRVMLRRVIALLSGTTRFQQGDRCLMLWMPWLRCQPR